MLFEVSQKDDVCTMVAEDPKIAMATALLLGEGTHSLVDEYGKSYDTVFLRYNTDVRKVLNKEFDGFDKFIEGNIGAVVECLNSIKNVRGGMDNTYFWALQLAEFLKSKFVNS